MDPIELSLQIAMQAHAGQMDKDGHPYILHPLAVGLMGHTDEEKMAGFLHDVVEDSDITCDDLRQRGIPEGIVRAVALLTHDRAMSYEEYIQSIIDSENPIALLQSVCKLSQAA